MAQVKNGMKMDIKNILVYGKMIQKMVTIGNGMKMLSLK